MRKSLFLFICAFLYSFTQTGCWTKAKNYKDARIVKKNDSSYLLLKGRRVPIHGSGTYEDSTLIPLPEGYEDTIRGESIYRPYGYFAYKGYLVITDNKVIVHLKIDDTADKVLRNDTWNGEYKLIK